MCVFASISKLIWSTSLAHHSCTHSRIVQLLAVQLPSNTMAAALVVSLAYFRHWGAMVNGLEPLRYNRKSVCICTTASMRSLVFTYLLSLCRHARMNKVRQYAFCRKCQESAMENGRNNHLSGNALQIFSFFGHDFSTNWGGFSYCLSYCNS